jgi:hypothetical protein
LNLYNEKEKVMTQMVLPNHPIKLASDILTSLQAKVLINEKDKRTKIPYIFPLELVQNEIRIQISLDKESISIADITLYTFVIEVISDSEYKKKSMITQAVELEPTDPVITYTYHTNTKKGQPISLINRKTPSTYKYREGLCIALRKDNEITLLKGKLIQIKNGSWAPSAEKLLQKAYQTKDNPLFLYFEAYRYPNGIFRPTETDETRIQLISPNKLYKQIMETIEPHKHVVNTNHALLYFQYRMKEEGKEFTNKSIEASLYPQDPYTCLPFLPLGMRLDVSYNPQGDIMNITPDWSPYYDFQNGVPL